MPLTLSVDLLSGAYDAAEVGDREQVEWPPHPARLFCALVAAARTDREWAALRALESLAPPVIEAAEQVLVSRREAYVVTNSVDREGGSQSHPGRTNGIRARVRALPASPRVRMCWDGDLEPDQVAAVDAMARRVPYLGRSTGIALVAASTSQLGPDASMSASLTRYEVCDVLDADLLVRVPYPGYLDALDAQFESGRPAWEVGRSRGYRKRHPFPAGGADVESDAVPVPSVYCDVVAFRFTGVRPEGRLAARFTEALRTAVLRCAGAGAPPVLHGHGADGRPHVAFLALPDVGFPHSDGHLLGLAVALPELPAGERREVLRAVLGLRRSHPDGGVDLAVPRIGSVGLLYSPGLVQPWGASPQRWRRGSTRWATATPVVLDRFPKARDAVEAEVVAGVLRVGLPEPVGVQVSTSPLLPGSVAMRPNDLPRQASGRLYRHVALTFDRVVHGPMLVGAGRYLGVGLFAPVLTGSVSHDPVTAATQVGVAGRGDDG